MSYEIEGKWLPAEGWGGVEALQHVGYSRIRQGYVASDPNGTVLRVREEDSTKTMTIKGKAEGGVKLEIERPIDSNLFNQLWGLTEGRRIEKRRYRIPLLGMNITLGGGSSLVAEVDIFEGRHTGLTIIEIEVPEVTILDFIRSNPPGWLGLEVTEDVRYSNVWLSSNGCPDS